MNDDRKPPRCRKVAKDQPRMVCRAHQRHERGEWCDECEPCLENHCRVCGHEHVPTTCVDCLNEAREALKVIPELCWSLPGEVEHRGVDSEAAHLDGPTALPEAWRQRRRWGYRDHIVTKKDGTTERPDVVGEDHPLWVLGTWDLLVTEHLGHTRRTGTVEIQSAADYLDRNLTYLAADSEFPFEDLHADLTGCRAHLEATLHDGEQHDRGAPCMKCGATLERTWGREAGQDGWKCPRCKRTCTEAEYRLAVAHLHREEAAWLTDRDMETRTGVKAGTVRAWAAKDPPLVAKRVESGRVVYQVADVERTARAKGLVA